MKDICQFSVYFLKSSWLLLLAVPTTTQDDNMMVHSTEAALDLQLAPTPAAAAMWPHWSWGVLLAVSLIVLGLLGVVCCVIV